MSSRRQTVGEIVKDNTHPGTLIVFGQISLILFLSISVALHPGFVFKSNEGGISNYGIHLNTAVPYTFAFILCAFFSLKAARLYARRESSTRHLGYLLYAYSCLIVLTLLSTYVYKINYAFKQVHVVVGVATISFELLASLWMYIHLEHFWDLPFLVMELAGFVLAGLTFLGTLHVLFLGQALATFGFALLLVHTGLRTPSPGQDRSSGDGPRG